MSLFRQVTVAGRRKWWNTRLFCVCWICSTFSFKVSSKGAVEADTKMQSTDGLQLLMTQARKRVLPKRKAEGGKAKDRLYNNIIDSLGQKGLDFPST